MSRITDSRSLGLLYCALFVAAVSVLLGGCRQYPNCKKDEHCEKFEAREAHGTPFCVNRICRECRDDSVCGRCEECNGGSCEFVTGCCADDIPCPAPQVCRDGRCGPQCLTNDDCRPPVNSDYGAFGWCNSGLCNEGECDSDADCPDGWRCERHMCIEPVVTCGDGNFRTVYFDFDESALTAAARTDLSWNLNCFEARNGGIEVQGHCDERGTIDYNIALGERRARAARDWYVDNGIPATRMTPVSYGESRPADPRHNEAAWRQNRRAEFVWR